MFEEFVCEARRLRDKYADRITLLIGMETEVIHEDSLAEIQTIRDRYHIEYLVGSVHHVGGVPLDFSKDLFELAERTAGGFHNLALQYFDIQYDLLQHARPDVIGHFDLVFMFRPEASIPADVMTKIERNINFAVSYGALFEINSRAYKKNLPEAHPRSEILKVSRDALYLETC